jgi:hypothetical protein
VSEVATDAIVRLLIADYAAVDAAGKLNVIGGGVSVIGYVQQVGTTSPFALVVSISVPPKHYNADCAVEIILEDSAGTAVSLPTPTGESQIMRIGQAVRLEEPKLMPGVPRHELQARTQFVIGFATGLPIPLGQRYVWRVKIDTETRHDWTEEFFVPGPTPGPVLG